MPSLSETNPVAPRKMHRGYAIRVGEYSYPMIVMGKWRTKIRGKPDFITDLTGFLHSRFVELPPPEAFAERDWLRPNFGEWDGEELVQSIVEDPKFEEHRLTFICEVEPKPDDPVHSASVCYWDYIEEVLKELSSLPGLG